MIASDGFLVPNFVVDDHGRRAIEGILSQRNWNETQDLAMISSI